MGVKSKGRGAAATFGFLLVLAGIVGAAVLWFMAERRPDQAIEGFARGPVGCTTTLDFTDTGRFYLYEEIVSGDTSAVADCRPVATPGIDFDVELLDDGRPVSARSDTSITYDTDVAVGTSIGWVEIVDPGRYDLVVRGSDATMVAAIGRDPDDGVDDLRRGAIAVGVVGVVLGGLMLLLAGRRSKKAATYETPTGPGWGPQQARPTADATWPPQAPTVPQMPVNPTLPPDRTVAGPLTVEPADVFGNAIPTAPSSTDGSSPTPERAPWAPPAAGERKDPPPPPE